MKRLFLAIAFMALPVSASAQDLVPVKSLRPTFYNESGTAVTVIAAGDTLVTQPFNLAEYDEIYFSLATEGIGDTAHVQVFVMQGDGAGAFTAGTVSAGFYGSGYETMSAKLDSIASDGLRNGAKTGASVCVRKLNVIQADSQDVAGQLYVDFHQPMFIKFVLWGEVNNQEVSNNDWLNNSKVVLRRKE